MDRFFDEEEVLRFCEGDLSDLSHKQVGKIFGCSGTLVSCIRHGGTYRDIKRKAWKSPRQKRIEARQKAAQKDAR